MAARIAAALEDDLDGGRADETVRFEFGAAKHDIDLSKKTAKAFRRGVAPYVGRAGIAAVSPPIRSS
ncbi:MAG: histone-like nucleoid-structuring protein Lsr2 [Streptosporangiaceae bacterium]